MKEMIYEPSEIHTSYLSHCIAVTNIHRTWEYYGIIQLRIPYERLKELNYPKIEGVGIYEINFMSFCRTALHTYITIAPSYESNDGEYMGRFSKLKNVEVPDSCIRSIRDYCIKHEIEVVVRFYPDAAHDKSFDPFYCIAAQSFYQSKFNYSSNRLGSRIFISPLIDYAGVTTKTIISTVLLSIVKDSVCRVYSKSLCNLGIKMYPLHNINFMNDLPIVLPWNEIYCLQIAQHLMVKCKTIFLPFYFGNKLIDTNDSHIYQNHSIIQRYESSLASISEIKELQAKKVGVNDDILTENIDNQIRALEDLTVLSGKSIMIFMNHVNGSVLCDTHAWLIDMSEFEIQHIWFGLFNALHMIYINGIFHGDLHLRNIIMGMMFAPPKIMDRYGSVIEFTVPAPDPDLESKYAAVKDMLDGKIKGSLENPAIYNLIFNQFTMNDHKASYKVEECSPSYEHGETKYWYYEGIQRNMTIIDFSRATVFDSKATAGIQPFKAHLRAMQFSTVYQAIVEWVKEYKNLGNKDMFISMCEEEPDIMLRALECLDLILFLERYALYHKGTADHMYEWIMEIIDYASPMIKINLRLADSQNFDLLKKQPSIYPQLYHKFCPRLLPGAESQIKKEDMYLIRTKHWEEWVDFCLVTRCKS